ncbi:MAG: DUF4340 domain-containing protein [Chloroflexi bacterium]|nr:DUF4340 domain-containing protein [Chloroflexota bacterium]
MNWKATLVLIVVAVVVATVAYINPFESTDEEKDDPPWFYQVSFDDVISIEISHYENQVSFTKIPPHAWVFEDPAEIPPDHFRWGGIVLLVSGPQTRRDFSTVRAIVDDPAEYGLETPELVVNVGLTANRSIQFKLGDETADGSFNYAQVTGFPQLFLIADSWGDVLARLADEPPIPKWFVKRDLATIEEVNVFLGDLGSEDGPVLRFQQKGGEWFAKNLGVDDVNRPLDADKWAEFAPLMAGPPDVLVEIPRVEDRDYTRWGIEDKGPSIEIRFSGTTDRGTKFIDGVLFLTGDKTEDGLHYYATAASDQVLNAVLKLDADWIETMYALFDTVPYRESSSAGTGADAKPTG